MKYMYKTHILYMQLYASYTHDNHILLHLMSTISHMYLYAIVRFIHAFTWYIRMKHTFYTYTRVFDAFTTNAHKSISRIQFLTSTVCLKRTFQTITYTISYIQ